MILFLLTIIGFAVYVNYEAITSVRNFIMAREFVSVQAKIVALKVEDYISSEGERYVKIANVRYGYDYGSRAYESTRVSIFPYVGHGSFASALSDARQCGSLITAWINPFNPNEAVLDREMRWGLVGWGILTVLVVMWAAIGVFCAIALIAVLFGKRLITRRST